MKRLIIFDLDGTLVDTPRAIVETFTAVLGAMEVPVPQPSAIRATIGLPLERALSLFMDVSPDSDRVARGIALYQDFFKQLVLPRARDLIFPGVFEGLADLRAHGCTLAVATSKFHASADALLQAAGLDGYFTIVVGADEVTRPKPDPETGLLILKSTDTASTDAVMVGDTTHDIQMANASGIRSIAVTYGVHRVEELRRAEPTWIADTFSDVLRWALTAWDTESVRTRPDDLISPPA